MNRNEKLEPLQQETSSQNVTIQNESGLHARAAASFVKMALRYDSEIEIIKGAQRANGKSIMGLLTLAAAKGSKITIEATGTDSEEAVTSLTTLVKDKFGES